VVGAVADMLSQAPGIPWSTIAVHVRLPFDPRLHECEHMMHAKIGSKSAWNSLNPGLELAELSVQSELDN
jgi:hypothetical protein